MVEDAFSGVKAGWRWAAVAAVVAAILAAGLFSGVGEAWANPRDIASLKGTVKVSMYKTGKTYITYGYAGNSAIKSAKSSNKKVATVKADNSSLKYGYSQLAVSLKKAGSTKLTFKYKGKKHVVKYKVYKYKNPVKTFKVGTKNYASGFRSTPDCSPARVVYGKVKVKPASGWKLKGISACLEKGGVKAVKNGYKIKKGALSNMWATLVNKKTGLEQSVDLYSLPVCTSVRTSSLMAAGI